MSNIKTPKSTNEELRNRRDSILKILIDSKDSSGTVKNLAETFNVSEMTIRRDLDFLEKNNFLERFYGGARLLKFDKNKDNNRDMYRKKIKEELARRASEYIKPNSTIFINSGETALNVVDFLYDQALIIITNNLNIYKKKTNLQTTTLLTGGEIRVPRVVLVGDLALFSLKSLFADFTILSCSGISAKSGISTNNLHELRINKTMIDNTKEKIIVVADYKKIGKSTNFIVDDITSVDILITDIYADKNEISKIEDLGVTVIQVKI